MGFIVFLVALSACGEKKATVEDKNDTPTASVQQKAGPTADKDREYAYNARLGNSDYVIRVKRSADKALPTVTDETGISYYDNRVEIVVTRNDEQLIARTFTKADFRTLLSKEEEKGTVLLGMAFDSEQSTPNAIKLGAQIGQPGIEEGPAFTVSLPLNGGTPTIERDNKQDSTGEDMMDEEG